MGYRGEEEVGERWSGRLRALDYNFQMVLYTILLFNIKFLDSKDLWHSQHLDITCYDNIIINNMRLNPN